MKTLPTILAVTLALVMAWAPMTAFAAGTVTFTSPTAGSTVSGAYIIAGTVNPAPTIADNLFIKVTNPVGNVVDAENVPVTIGTGAFTYSTFTGTGSTWVTGTYTISGTDSNGATGSTTFLFQAPAQTTGGLALQMSAVASNPVMPGDTVGVNAWVAWNNGTAVTSATFAGWWVNSGGATKLTSSPTSPTAGDYWWSIPVPSSASDGLNAVVLVATVGKYQAWSQTSFTVDSSFASSAQQTNILNSISTVSSAVSALQQSVNGVASSLTTLSGTVGGIQSTLGTVNTNVGNLGTAVAGIQSSLTSLGNTVTSINQAVTGLTNSMSTLSTNVGTAVTAAQAAATAANNAVSAANDAKTAINNTSTYVLAVVVIAAITLVLELAILVRKLS